MLDRLERENLQSDTRFAEAFVNSRAGRGDGPVKILHQLSQRGVDSARIDQALESAEVDWICLATRAREKRFGTTPPDDYQNRARQTRFLTQRGFTSAQVRQALRGRVSDDC